MKRLATLGLVMAAAALTAAGQFTITTTAVPSAFISQPYPTVTLATSGDPGPMTWTFSDGGPPGFTVGPGSTTTGSFCYNSCSGVVVAAPVGAYSFTVQATSLTTGKTASQNFTLVVEYPLQIVNPPLPNANANQPYSTALEGFGGTGQYSWSILTGSLPPGLVLDAFKGVIAGTAPGTNGTYPFTVRLLDEISGEKVVQGLSITVVNGLSILTTTLPNATLSQPYSVQLMGTPATAVWSGSSLPLGFGVSPSGLLSGVGVATGSFSFTVQAVDPRFTTVSVSQRLTLLVTLGELNIVELTLPTATQNIPYSTTLTAFGGIPPYLWGLGVVGTPGISINSVSGVISGTPTKAGSFAVPVTLQDSTGASFIRNFNLDVGNGVSITTASLPNGSPNVPYSATLTAAGGVLTYTWSVLTGSLPAGLTLGPTSGQISGTPTTAGAFQFTAQVTDFKGGTSTKVFTITIGTGQPLTITTLSSLPGGSLNQPYSRTLSAVGGTQPVTSWAITSGSLPVGLSLDRSTGEVSGTPTVLGSSSFTVQATDSANQTATRNLTLLIATPVTISANSFTTSVGVAVSQPVVAAGGVQPYGFLVSSGNLPPGLLLDVSTGVISGTPSATGTFPVTLRVTDIDARGATASISIIVNDLPLTIVVPGSTGSNQQPGIGVSIPTAAAGDVTGTLGLVFASSVGGTDKMVRFSNGSTSVSFTIPKGSTTAPNATVITGTVAGTITLTARVPGGPDNIKTITIDTTVPVISSVTLQQVTGGLSVVVVGYSNTREVSSGSFTFTLSNATSSGVIVTVPLTAAYATWFGNTASNDTGGQFKLTVPFSVTQGSASAITKVSVTLTNSKGASAAVSSP